MRSQKKLLIVPILCSALLCSGCSSLFGQTQVSQAKYYDYSQMELIQLEEPEEGRMTAVIKTSLGDITAVLYPEYAPNTVNNFVNRANEGYYDHTLIYGVVEKNYAITGSAAEDGSEGATDDGNPIENEYSQNLWPFKGALCSFFPETGYGDSRYFIINTMEMTEENADDLREPQNDDGEQLLPEELIQAFMDNGGMPTLMGFFTVFGQVVDGWDVFEQIINAEVDAETYRPTEDIYVETVEITEYHKN